MTTIRKPAVAGYFYPDSKSRIEAKIDSMLDKNQEQEKTSVLGVILPHAGWEYSGSVAVQTLSRCRLKERLIIIGPNHTGGGEMFSVMTKGQWETPLGTMNIDQPLAQELTCHSEYLKADEKAHLSEHCIEVLLPLLQSLQQTQQMVPIIVSKAKEAIYKIIANDIVQAIKDCKLENRISIVASTDMTHYEPQEMAQKKDNYAIEAILSLDAQQLYKRVKEKRITMCGVIAVYILIEVTKALGAKNSELVQYQTSGDASGDFSSVVGYAGISIN